MRQTTVRAWLIAALSVAVLFTLIGPVWAQDAAKATGPKSTSAFQMFFISPGSPFGTAQIWVIIVMSIAVVALATQAIMANRGKVMMPPATVAEYEDLLEQKRYSEAIEKAAVDNTAFGQVMHASLSEAANGYGAMERAIEEQGDYISAKRIRGLEMLNVLGATGPMVGLFGTVYGMIVAFQVIVDSGGQPKPAELAGGVSTALVTTFWGLIVGIPAVATSALVRNHIDETVVGIMIRVEGLISRFKPSKKPAASSSRPAAPKPKAAEPKPVA